MSLHHSEATHQQLIARVPQATGRDLPEWFETLDEGPGLLRFDERVNWLRDEHGISHGHAIAIVHEHDKLRRGARRALPGMTTAAADGSHDARRGARVPARAPPRRAGDVPSRRPAAALAGHGAASTTTGRVVDLDPRDGDEGQEPAPRPAGRRCAC